MKNQRKLVAGLVMAAALTGAAVAGAVTLTNSPKTPCAFGALGNATSCALSKSAPMSKAMPKSPAPTLTQGPLKPALQPQVQASVIVDPPIVIQASSTGTKPQVSPVPVPVAGSLLAASLGLVFAAGRRRKIQR